METPQQSEPRKIVPRSERRGSVLRREALERLRQGKGGPHDSGQNKEDEQAIPNEPPTAGRPFMAWGVEQPRPGLQEQEQEQQQQQQEKEKEKEKGRKQKQQQHRQRRRSWLKSLWGGTKMLPSHEVGKNAAVMESPSVVSKMTDLNEYKVTNKNAAAAATLAEGGRKARAKTGNDGEVTETLSQRTEASLKRRRSRRRESSLRVEDLERLSAGEMGETFRKLYVPPLGPFDDPPGVIYLDEKLTEKTVDTRVLDTVGEGVREARKELFDLGMKRHSLVEEIRAQNRRVSLGFPRNLAAEAVLEKRAQESDSKREKAEGKLKRLLNHRRRLFDVLEVSNAEEERSVALLSKIAQSEMPRTGEGRLAGMDTLAVTGIGKDSNTGNGARRSSLDDLKDLANELMAREPIPTLRDVATVDRSKRQSMQRGMGTATQDTKLPKEQKRALNQGWREVMEAVFSEEAVRRRLVVRFHEGAGEDVRERKECDIRSFMAATTPKEHVEFLVVAMDPARAKDLSSVIKCLLLHYTGPAAGELDILLGGRIGGMQVQELLEMSLEALDHTNVDNVPSVLMLQWLLGRAPHLRSALLRGGVVGRAFRRLDRAEAKGFGSGERAMQYAALFLVMGLLFG